MGYRERVLADSPLQYFRLNERSGATVMVDSGPNATNGSHVNSPLLSGTTGPLSTPQSQPAAGYVNASTQYSTFPATAQNAIGDTFSIEFWLKHAANAADRDIHYRWQSGVPGTGQAIYMGATGLIAVAGASGVGLLAFSSIEVDDNVWHHIVWAKSGATNKIYIDGVDRTTFFANGTLTNTAATSYIASLPGAGQPNGLDGYVAEFATYATALTSTQINDHFTAAGMGGLVLQPTAPTAASKGTTTKRFFDYPNSRTVAAASALTKTLNFTFLPKTYAQNVAQDMPIQWFRLNELSGTTAKDSANNVNGVIGGAPTYNQTGALSTAQADPAMLFGFGGGGLIAWSHAASLNQGDSFTIQFWIAAGDTTVNKDIFSEGQVTGGKVVRLDASGKIALRYWNTTDVCLSTIAIDDGAYHHVVITKSGATVKIYIDNVDRTGTVTNQTFTNPAVGTTSTLGYSGAGGTGYAPLDGYLDEFARYNYPLSGGATSRIEEHYKSALRIGIWKPISQATSVAHYMVTRIFRTFDRAGGGSFANPILQGTSFEQILYPRKKLIPRTFRDEVMQDDPRWYLRLAETSGNVAKDETLFRNDGEYVNTPTLGQPGALTAPQATFAVTFDAAQQEYVNIPYRPSMFIENSFSIEFWIKMPATAVTRWVMYRPYTGGHIVGITSAGKVELWMFGSGVVGRSQAGVADNNWHHVMITKPRTPNLIYVDGAPSDEVGSFTDRTFTNQAVVTVIGLGLSATDGLTGTLDEIAMYSYAVPGYRVSDHYNAAFRTGRAALVSQAVTAAIGRTPKITLRPLSTYSLASTKSSRQGFGRTLDILSAVAKNTTTRRLTSLTPTAPTEFAQALYSHYAGGIVGGVVTTRAINIVTTVKRTPALILKPIAAAAVTVKKTTMLTLRPVVSGVVKLVTGIAHWASGRWGW